MQGDELGHPRAPEDRPVACPWLTTGFIDPETVFRYAPPSQVLAVAETEDATPYDLPGVAP